MNDPSNVSPNILVVGTGAIGGFYGGKLSQAGANVATVCRTDYRDIQKQGIEITSPLGNFHFAPKQVLPSVEEYTLTPDYIIVGFKVLPEIDVSTIIRPAVGKKTTIVLLQNGINVEKHVANNFPENQIVSGLAFICVSRVGSGKIFHQDYGRIVIGHFPKGITEEVRVLGRLFKQSGLDCDITENSIEARWKKLIWNAPFNPISVLAGGVSTKQILASQESSRLVRNVMEEVCLIAKSEGYPLSESVIERNLEDTKKMRPYKTSMLLDYEAKRPMEVEAILGNTVRLARKNEVSVPYLETLYSLLQLKDQQNRLKV